MEMKRKIKVFIEWLELFALSFGSIFFYVYILACIWLLKRARNYSGLFLHLDKCHEKVYIWRYKQDLTVYAISLCFYKKCSMRSNYERVQLCCALSVRQITRRNALKVRVFFGSSALLPALKSVQNRCEIFNGFYLKFRPIKVYRGGFKNFCNKIFDIF